MRPIKLSESDVEDRLRSLSDWRRTGDVILKTFEFANFIRAMEFVNQVAESAEEVQHHPDIDIRYNKVTIALTTHDAGGLTGNDFNFANFADEIGLATLGAA